MAHINQLSSDSKEYSNLLGSWVATICLIAGMVISLLGIKIWWFKHRLNFEQNSAQNGESRGSQSMLREKKQSQQVSDSVVVHGIFRKRNEDELEVFERPKQLPPIRVPLRSMGATALIPPPRTKRNGNLKSEIPTASLQSPAFAAPNSPTYVEENRVNHKVIDEPTIPEATVALNVLHKGSEAYPPIQTFPEGKNLQSSNTDQCATGILSVSELQGLETLLTHDKTENEFQKQQVRNHTEEMRQESIEVNDIIEIQEKSKNPPLELFFKDLESVEDFSDGSVYKQISIENDEIPNSFQTSHEPVDSSNKSQQATVTNEKIDLNRIWHEMDENIENLDNKFHNHIYDEFEKRRQSYQEHEGHFLELIEDQLTQERALSPVGFGKSIDEDWESFKDLKKAAFNEMDQLAMMNSMTSGTTTTDLQELKAHFDLNELQTVTEPHSYFARSKTAYVQSIEELYDELSDNDEEQTANKIVIVHSVSPPQKSSILKERLEAFTNSGYEAPTGRAHKLKQKVTFDVHTEEYYPPESDSDSIESTKKFKNNSKCTNEHDFNCDDDDDEDVEPPHTLPPSLQKSSMPIPMHRTTKIQYFVGDIETEQKWMYNEVGEDQQQVQSKQQQQHLSALLFSTQNSLDNSEANDTFDTNNDSCTTIRQKRYQNVVDEKLTLTPISHGSPRPAHRNALADQTQVQPTPRLRRSGTEA